MLRHPTLLLLPLSRAEAKDEAIKLAADPFEITDPNAAPPVEAEIAMVGFHERARRGVPHPDAWTIGCATRLG